MNFTHAPKITEVRSKELEGHEDFSDTYFKSNSYWKNLSTTLGCVLKIGNEIPTNLFFLLLFLGQGLKIFPVKGGAKSDHRIA